MERIPELDRVQFGFLGRVRGLLYRVFIIVINNYKGTNALEIDILWEVVNTERDVLIPRGALERGSSSLPSPNI